MVPKLVLQKPCHLKEGWGVTAVCMAAYMELKPQPTIYELCKVLLHTFSFAKFNAISIEIF